MSWRQVIKTSTTKSTKPKPKFETNCDDWETDISYQNDSTEKSQRFGSSSVTGSGRVNHVDFNSMQEKIKTADNAVTKAYQDKNPNRGYGGKYGTEQVMDKTAADFSYKADIKKDSSQTDEKKEFGGQHETNEPTKNTSTNVYDYRGVIEKQSSQIENDSLKGFQGESISDQKNEDKTVVEHFHVKKVAEKSSQKDSTTDSSDKINVPKEVAKPIPTAILTAKSTNETKVVEKPATSTTPKAKADVSSIRAKFESMGKQGEMEAAARVAEQRKQRALNDRQLAAREETAKLSENVSTINQLTVQKPTENDSVVPIVSEESSKHENETSETKTEDSIIINDEQKDKQQSEPAKITNVISSKIDDNSDADE